MVIIYDNCCYICDKLNIMGLFDLFSNKKAELLKNHLTNLLVVANADGEIDENEFNLITKIAYSNGLNEREFSNILNNIKVTPPIVPKTLEEKFIKVRQLFSVAVIDGKIHDDEYGIVCHIASTYGLDQKFTDNILDRLLFSLGLNPYNSSRKDYKNIIAEQEKLSAELDDLNDQLDEIEKNFKR